LHNGLRFERGTEVIPQTPSTTAASTLTHSSSGGVLHVDADLSAAFAPGSGVQQWHRSLEYAGDTLRITDSCSVASGVKPVFQLDVPVQPQLQPNGTVVAGHLRITPLQAVATPVFLDLKTLPPFDAATPSNPNPPKDFTSIGYQISFESTQGCSFRFELQAQ
jgi:hypothetical protein